VSLSNVSYLDPRLSTAESGALFASYRPVVVYPCQVTCKRPAQDPIAALRLAVSHPPPVKLRNSKQLLFKLHSGGAIDSDDFPPCALGRTLPNLNRPCSPKAAPARRDFPLQQAGPEERGKEPLTISPCPRTRQLWCGPSPNGFAVSALSSDADLATRVLRVTRFCDGVCLPRAACRELGGVF